MPIVATFIGLPLTPVFYLSPNLNVALLAAIGPSLAGAAFVGPAYAMSQALVPLRMRTRAAAILLFILNIIRLFAGSLDRRRDQRRAQTHAGRRFTALCAHDRNDHWPSSAPFVTGAPPAP